MSPSFPTQASLYNVSPLVFHAIRSWKCPCFNYLLKCLFSFLPLRSSHPHPNDEQLHCPAFTGMLFTSQLSFYNHRSPFVTSFTCLHVHLLRHQDFFPLLPALSRLLATCTFASSFFGTGWSSSIDTLSGFFPPFLLSPLNLFICLFFSLALPLFHLCFSLRLLFFVFVSFCCNL